MWVPDKGRLRPFIRRIADGEGGGKELLGSIRPAVRIAGSMTLGCTGPAGLRLFFPSGGVSLGAPIYITLGLVRRNTKRLTPNPNPTSESEPAVGCRGRGPVSGGAP